MKIFFVKHDEIRIPNTETEPFIVLHQNIASFLSKKDVIQITISELEDKGSKPDVLCFSETHVRKGEEKNITLKNYELVANFSRETKRGGTCILLKRGIAYKELTCFGRHVLPNIFECCGVEVLAHNLIIVCVYTSHNKYAHTFLTKLEVVIHELLKRNKNKKIIITGDFNINTLVASKASCHLTDIASQFDLTLHIKQPTRGGNCIDHILSNIKNGVGKVLPLQLSDHDTAQTISIPVNKVPLIQNWYVHKRDFSIENQLKFRNYLRSLSFSDVYQEKNMNVAFNLFHEILCLLYNQCFPKITLRLNNKPRKQKV